MIDKMMEPRAMLEKSTGADLLREMIGFAAGCRERDWETHAGTVELRIPKLRRTATSPAPWSRAGWPRRRSLRCPGGLHPGHLDTLGEESPSVPTSSETAACWNER